MIWIIVFLLILAAILAAIMGSLILVIFAVKAICLIGASIITVYVGTFYLLRDIVGDGIWAGLATLPIGTAVIALFGLLSTFGKEGPLVVYFFGATDYTNDRRKYAVTAVVSLTLGIVILSVTPSAPSIVDTQPTKQPKLSSAPTQEQTLFDDGSASSSTQPLVSEIEAKYFFAPTQKQTLANKESAPAATQSLISESEAKMIAVQRYPELAIVGSKLNAKFVGRYMNYKHSRRDYFNDTSWPINLAEELVSEMEAKHFLRLRRNKQ
jgi:hypothetical protein